MRRAGLAPGRQIRLLRGVFYGSTHSLDFDKRHSRMRNLGFNLYLRSPAPPDPVPLLGSGLVDGLKRHGELAHQGRRLDLGHVLVGLEGRLSASVRRLAVLAQGGTGLELCTWVGDLGGAAGMLAIARMDAPSTRARDLLFSPGAYDLSANLEGDLAGYLLARQPDSREPLGPPKVGVLDDLSGALRAYLGDGGQGCDWDRRWRLFAPMIGARLGARGIANREALARRICAKTLAFASVYTVYRLRQDGRLGLRTLREACRNLHDASTELGRIFFERLEQGLGGRDPMAGPLEEPNLEEA